VNSSACGEPLFRFKKFPAMPELKISSVRVAGVASAVPRTFEDVATDAPLFGEGEAQRIAQSTGIASRRVARAGLCASDLCVASAERLLADLGWERDSVRAVIFVSQTPDHTLPATACLIQGRLGLSKNCAAFDVGLGCSGYVYGLWLAHNLVRGGCERLLLLVGDTLTRVVSPHDRTAKPIFGDAGSATALELAGAEHQAAFSLGTSGTGAENLIIPAGGFRTPATAETGKRIECESGNQRSAEDIFMHGPEVFAFTIREVPKLVEATLAVAGWQKADVDFFVFHQANQFMLNHLIKRIGVPPEKMVWALEGFGNTSGASIPLAINHALRGPLAGGPKKLLLAGFGAGLSWGGAAVEFGPMCVPEIVEVA